MATKSAATNPVNPSHHKNFLGDLQWAEAYAKDLFDTGMQPSAVKRIVLSWADKYFDRMGRKDAIEQEILKGMWYLRFAKRCEEGVHRTFTAPEWDQAVRHLLDSHSLEQAMKAICRPTSRFTKEHTLGALGTALYSMRNVRDINLELALCAVAVLQLREEEVTIRNVEKVLLSF